VSVWPERQRVTQSKKKRKTLHVRDHESSEADEQKQSTEEGGQPQGVYRVRHCFPEDDEGVPRLFEFEDSNNATLPQMVFESVTPAVEQ
jgi:hypothetical protein